MTMKCAVPSIMKPGLGEQVGLRANSFTEWVKQNRSKFASFGISHCSDWN